MHEMFSAENLGRSENDNLTRNLLAQPIIEELKHHVKIELANEEGRRNEEDIVELK